MAEATAPTPPAPPAAPAAPTPPSNGQPPATSPAPPATWMGTPYLDQDAFDKGYRELSKKTGREIPDHKQVIGGVHPSADIAVVAYKALQGIYQQQREAAKARGEADPEATPNPAKPGDGAVTDPPDTGLRLGKTPEPKGATIAERIESVGLKNDDLFKQLTEKGDYTEDQYKLLERAFPGVPREAMLEHGRVGLNNLRVAQAQVQSEAARIVNGNDSTDGAKLKMLLDTAPQYVPAEEMEDLQARLHSAKHFRGALRDLLAFHAKANGSDKSRPLVTGDAPPATGGAFTTYAEKIATVNRAATGDEEAKARYKQHLQAVKNGARDPIPG